ncbi:MAG: HAD family phosphatase [Pseudomonadota bacterium]
MTEIRHIVFDVGRVLLNWDVEIPYRRLIPDPEQREWFLANVCTPDWNLRQDLGRSWREAEDELIAKFPDHEENIRNFRRCWIETIPTAVDGTPEILDRLLQAGWDVTLLTNFNQETFPLAREKYPFLDSARGATVSGEVELIKPDLAIYQHHCAAFDLDPAACLFFDDSQKNVDGAIAADWQARLFVDAAGMRSDLTSFGIEVGGS